MGRILFRKIRSNPQNIVAITSLVNGRVDFRSSFLNEGYFTSLTFIIERNIMIPDRPSRQDPVAKSCSSHHIRNRVKEATKPAAAGIGNPRNSPPPPPLLIAD